MQQYEEDEPSIFGCLSYMKDVDFARSVQFHGKPTVVCFITAANNVESKL